MTKQARKKEKKKIMAVKVTSDTMKITPGMKIIEMNHSLVKESPRTLANKQQISSAERTV